MTITLAAVYTPVAHPGRPDGRAVPRVRVHAGRRGDRLRRRGADAVADDGLAAAARRATPSAASPAASTAASSACGAATRARSAGRSRTGRSVLVLWAIVVAADGAVLPVLAARSWRRPRTRASSSASCRRRRTRRSTRRSCSPRRSTTSIASFPETAQHLPDHVPDRRLRRHGHEAVERARARPPQQLLMESAGKLVEDPGHPRHPADAAAAAGRRRLPGRLRDRVDRRAASSWSSSRTSWSARRSRAACSCSPTPT